MILLHYVIIYDITDDALRHSVANKLKDYGLIRVQLSGFLGELYKHKLNSLIAELNFMLSRVEAKEGDRRNVQIYPLCGSCYSGRMVVGRLMPIAEEPREVGGVVVL